MKKLRDCVEQLREAMLFEGIADDTPLGVWCRAQQAALLSLGMLVEMQTIRIEDRAEATERANKASADCHAKAIEELRAATVAARAQAALTDERRKAEGLVLAKEVAADIKKAIAATMVIREVRWNRVQHWKGALFAACVVLLFFVGGTVWSAYRRDHAMLERCFAHQVPDTTGKVYCPMDVVGGGL